MGAQTHTWLYGKVERLDDATSLFVDRLLAYEEDTRGDEAYTLRVRDLETGKQLDRPIHVRPLKAL